MTLGELRELTKDLPDSTPVVKFIKGIEYSTKVGVGRIKMTPVTDANGYTKYLWNLRENTTEVLRIG